MEERIKFELDNMLDKSLRHVKKACMKIKDFASYQEDKEEEFKELFMKKYVYVMDEFMDSTTISLDAHKQGSILTVSCLESGIVKANNDILEDDEINIFPEVMAVNLGLSFMLESLNKNLQDHKMKQKIEKYLFPVAFSCDTPYMEIMCRILYYDKEKGMPYNILELSEKYFLIEYITLLQSGIEPLTLKEKLLKK